MTAGQIVAIVYGSGLFAGLVVAGATGARWYDRNWEFGPAFLVFVWPLGLPWVLGRLIGRRIERKRLRDEERRKWLEAPLP